MKEYERSSSIVCYRGSRIGGLVIGIGIWSQRADAAQADLVRLYWDDSTALFRSTYPPSDESGRPFNYWWQAHALDALVDGFSRTCDEKYITAIKRLRDGVLRRNGSTLVNDYYDDMEWMALALLRASDSTGDEEYAADARSLWTEIKAGWNDHVGGGFAWRKTQLDYKNAPANAPAAILAARLFERDGDRNDLDWARRTYDWLRAHLVDPESGLVWDGANRRGDGLVDKAWLFSYCQGVYIGAATELYRCTGDRAFVGDAASTATTALRSLADPSNQILRAEGEGDGGLFRGILIRYLLAYLPLAPAPLRSSIEDMLLKNGRSLWAHIEGGGDTVFASDWAQPATLPVDLSVNLSGVMLMEVLARMESNDSVEEAFA